MGRLWNWLTFRSECDDQVRALPPVEPLAAIEPPKPAELTKGQRAAAAIAAAALIATPMTASFEGLRTTPYKDPVGIPTVCYGETQVAMRVYGKDECARMLRAALAKRYAPQILKCVPGFVEPRRVKMFAASLDASYNTGAGAFCKGRIARAFNAGQWTRGCNLFVGWYETAGGKRFNGLVRRRAAEKKLCLEAAA